MKKILSTFQLSYKKVTVGVHARNFYVSYTTRYKTYAEILDCSAG
jgi:hypothetical protein